MRDYDNLDLYYTELLQDVYNQPSDSGHTYKTYEIIRRWVLPLQIDNVLDVGCGQGEAGKIFESGGVEYLGIAQGEDVTNSVYWNVVDGDYNFLDFPDNHWEMVFSRHSLEHSPFPLLTLMEWHRVSSKWLCVVLPNPDHYTFIGRNHYSVMDSHQAAWILRRAGWRINKFHMDEEEIWFLCDKMPRIGYEGWIKAPVSPNVHVFERDELYLYGDIDVIKYFAVNGMVYE